MTAEELRRLKRWFASTVRTYRDGDEDLQTNVRLKAHHTHQVCLETRGLARSLGLSPAQGRLAEAAALLHDIGRFEQYRRFRTFNDAQSIDHAQLGLAILQDSQVFGDLEEDQSTVIIEAIGAHNRPTIPEGLNASSLLISRILRDADKLDIWRIILDHYEGADDKHNGAVVLGLPDTPGVTSLVLRRLSERVPVLRRDLRNVNDLKLFQVGWAYDLNLWPTFHAVRRRRYIERLGAKLPPSAEVKDVIQKVLQYVAERCEGTRDRASAH